MLQGYPLFVEEIKSNLASTGSNLSFIGKEILWVDDSRSEKRLYQQVVYDIVRKPKHLVEHIQRIHYTYSRGMRAPLYAALVDLFFILDGKGMDLCERMLSSTRSLLSKQQGEILDGYIEQPNKFLLVGNKFSVLTDGVIGFRTIVTERKNEVIEEHDTLLIARDYVEYSQLDAAVKTLEVGVLDKPDRLDLQNELLELYKVTKNIQSFNKMYKLLKEKTLTMSDKWQELNDSFTGLCDE